MYSSITTLVLQVHVSGVIPSVSILGFENCQSFFSATAHVQCIAPARPTPRGRSRSAFSILYWQNDTAIVISAYNMRATV